MESIIGIDFGTTNSAVAVYRNSKLSILADESGERIIPSAVHIGKNGTIYIGQAAKNVSVLHVDSTILSVKRMIGKEITYQIHNKKYSSEDIASYIIRRLKNLAESSIKQKIEKAVVTVPAYFDDTRRQAIKKSTEIAGLNVVRLINEPTAAALAYGLRRKTNGYIAIFDLGGGTFDVSILRVEDGVFEVCATRGDTHLGGNDFDEQITEVILERFKEENGIDLRQDKFALQKVFEEAEKAKRSLSSQKIARVEIPFISADDNGPIHLSTRITRREFEELIMHYVERTVRLTKGALKDAGLRTHEIDKLVLIGGSTHIPCIQNELKALFQKEPEVGIHPEETVALGAAVQGAILSGSIQDNVLVDVTPLGLGVESSNDRMVTIIPRNTVLPVRAKRVFTTVENNQRTATIHVLQGERPRSTDNISLGAFRLAGIQPASKGDPSIEVCLEIDVNGIVHVSAEDLDSKIKQSIQLDHVLDIPKEKALGIITEARASELEDLRFRNVNKR
jgi:molecular chaperone DnaK